MYYHKLITIAFFALALPSIAEVEVNPTYYGEIGLSTTSKMTMFQGTISDLGVDLSQVGKNAQVDFSKELEADEIFMQAEIASEILRPSDTPYKHIYPDADKVVYSRGEMMPEQWMYLSSENSVENLLGICSMGMCENGMPELTKAQGLDGSLWKNPIVLGDEWIFSFDKSKITLVPGLDVYFASNYTNTVDSEGIITTPAGSFRGIRLSRVGTEIVRYDDEQLNNSMGEGRSEVTEQFWFSSEGYTVIHLREEVISFTNLPGSPMEQTTVTVLTSVNGVETAVEQSTWGNLKNNILLGKIRLD